MWLRMVVAPEVVGRGNDFRKPCAKQKDQNQLPPTTVPMRRTSETTSRKGNVVGVIVGEFIRTNAVGNLELAFEKV